MLASPKTYVVQRAVAGSFHSMYSKIREFTELHAGRLRSHGPTYCLTRPAIESLAKQSSRKPAFLGESDREFELALADLCKQSSAVGIWNGNPVQFPYLQPPLPPPSRAAMMDCGWSAQQAACVEGLVTHADETRQRLKGYVGWLVTDPDFLAARDQLAKEWGALPLSNRLSFPLQRSVSLPERPPGSRPATSTAVQFQEQLDAFLDHWGLTQMVTWDLPDPQGPLIPADVPANSPSMPKHGLHIVLPIHYPLLGSDGLLLEIQRQQVYLAQGSGLPTAVAGLPHHDVYGQLLEVEHIERTIRSRYDMPGRSRGLVGAVLTAIAGKLGCGVENAVRLRKGISACKRGQRQTVAWLRPRVSGLTR